MAEEADKQWADEKFKSLQSFQPARKVDAESVELGGEGDHASFEHQIEHSPKLSDVAVVIKQLFADLGVDWLTKLQMARVLPQYYDYLKFICVAELIRVHRMPPAQAIVLAEIAVGVALDGEGRIEGIAVIGKAETNEEAKAKTGLGLP